MLDRKLFEKRLDRKLLLNLKRHDGVINRRNGCGSTVAALRLFLDDLK
jgi:tmRNA-binding protein